MAREGGRDAPNPFVEYLGLRIVEAAEGVCRTTVAVAEPIFNRYRVAHGGALFTMIDGTMSEALFSLLGAGEDCSTIENKINYVRPAGPGELTCEARVLHCGRTTAVVEATIRQGDKVVAVGQGSYAVQRGADDDATT